MDDPWGSPWTTNDVDTTLHKTPSPTKSGLEPPPRALLSNNSSPRLPTSTIHSPWADDDDGFKDWPSANTSLDTAQSTSAWAGWAGAENTSTEHLDARSRQGSFNKASSPIAWPGSIALSPGPNQANASIFRQLPSDPWASELSAEDLHNVQPPPSLIVAKPPDSPVTSGKTEEHTTTREFESIWNDKIDHAGAPGQDTAQVAAASDAVSSDAQQPPATPASLDDELPVGVSRINIETEARSIHSRSSSASGDTSDHDAGRQDSPITSVDGDSKLRLQAPSRTVSGKVQELVVKFDSLAKSVVEEPAPARRDREGTPAEAAHDKEQGWEGGADFGDFEDGGNAPAPAQISRGSSTERTPTPGIYHDSTEQIDSAAPRVSTPTSPRASIAGTKAQQSVAGFGLVKFVVDLDTVDSLFESDKSGDSEFQNAPDVDVPDRPINDSFTEISERKTWYRISRQGSSRMHNDGDDDNYCRVSWLASSTRQETLKIVRRWMEEDSITGRVTLGGGTGKRNMFGWDSAAEPISLDKVFGRTKTTHPRVSSQPQGLAPVLSLEAPSSPTQHSSMAVPRVASFGWSTASAANESTQPASASAPQAPLPLSSKRVVPLAVAVPPPPPAGDDEDEWGEMVSSPQDEARPAISDGLGSLDAAFSEPEPFLPVAVAPKPTSTTLPPTATRQPVVPTIPIVPTNIVAELSSSSRDRPAENSSASDTWTSVDISFLDRPAKPTVATTTNLPVPAASPPKVSREATPRQTVLAPPVRKETTESDSLARHIIDGLPNLSYMLR